MFSNLFYTGCFFFFYMVFDDKFVKEFYNYHLRKFGKEDIRGMGWHDEEEYSVRFDIVSKVGELENASILDVGCGFGGLYKYFKSSELKYFDYLGIDIVPDMIKIAKEKNPTGKFEVMNLLEEDFSKFDYIFCIGTLNITTHNFEAYFMDMVKKMISLSNKAVVINFLSAKEHLVKGPYYFQNAEELKKELMKKFPNLQIKIINDERIKGESCFFIFKSS
jgi:SAM-dependent methyltransferase